MKGGPDVKKKNKKNKNKKKKKKKKRVTTRHTYGTLDNKRFLK